MKTASRSYRATFILDNRGKEDTADTLIETVKKDIADVQGEVTHVENLGKKDFVRVTDRKFTGAFYVQVSFSGPPGITAALKEKLRLQHHVYRTFVESM